MPGVSQLVGLYLSVHKFTVGNHHLQTFKLKAYEHRQCV